MMYWLLFISLDLVLVRMLLPFIKDLKSSAINATKMFANFTKIAEQVGGFSNPWLVFKTHDDDFINLAR